VAGGAGGQPSFAQARETGVPKRAGRRLAAATGARMTAAPGLRRASAPQAGQPVGQAQDCAWPRDAPGQPGAQRAGPAGQAAARGGA